MATLCNSTHFAPVPVHFTRPFLLARLHRKGYISTIPETYMYIYLLCSYPPCSWGYATLDGPIQGCLMFLESSPLINNVHKMRVFMPSWVKSYSPQLDAGRAPCDTLSAPPTVTNVRPQLFHRPHPSHPPTSHPPTSHPPPSQVSPISK